MAAKIRNLLSRNGRYYARLTVPAALRPIAGKRELLAPLGGDRTLALRGLPARLAGFQAELDQARQALTAAQCQKPQAETIGPKTLEQIVIDSLKKKSAGNKTRPSLDTRFISGLCRGVKAFRQRSRSREALEVLHQRIY